MVMRKFFVAISYQDWKTIGRLWCSTTSFIFAWCIGSGRYILYAKCFIQPSCICNVDLYVINIQNYTVFGNIRHMKSSMHSTLVYSRVCIWHLYIYIMSMCKCIYNIYVYKIIDMYRYDIHMQCIKEYLQCTCNTKYMY